MDYVLLGGGGLALEIYEFMIHDKVRPRGYYSKTESPQLKGVLTYLGDEADPDNHIDSKSCCLLAVGDLELRRELITRMESLKLNAGCFISSQAYVSSLATLGKGAIVAPLSSITGNPNIGAFLLLHYGASISHDSCLGTNVVLSPGARITGGCHLGNDVTLGTNAALIPGTRIGDHCKIGIETFPPRKVESYSNIVYAPGQVRHHDPRV